MKKVIIAAIAVSVVSVATAFAHGGATGVVKERMDMMGNLKSAIKVLVPIMKGDIEFNSEEVITQSKIIQENSGKHMIMSFPEGSIEGPSEAKPNIWENWGEFQSMSNNLTKLAIGLERSATNPLHSGAKMNESNTMMNQNMSSSNMMGQSMMQSGQGMMSADIDMDKMAFEKMPPNGVFNMLTQSCSACHTKFRIDN